MRVVVLGTGTDVGKTFVTACVASALRAHARVLGLKPIESGVAGGTAGDAGVIAAAAGHAPLLSRWRFGSALSPHLAARQQGLSIDVAEVVAWVAEQELAASPEVTLIESAGGALSPLSAGASNVDLALALAPALWLLVAPDALGVLHDLSATLRALPRAPDAVVLSSARPADASTGRNAPELRALGISEILAVFERDAREANAVLSWLRAHPLYNAG